MQVKNNSRGVGADSLPADNGKRPYSRRHPQLPAGQGRSLPETALIRTPASIRGGTAYARGSSSYTRISGGAVRSDEFGRRYLSAM